MEPDSEHFVRSPVSLGITLPKVSRVHVGHSQSQQPSIGHLPCARHCGRCWVYSWVRAPGSQLFLPGLALSPADGEM